MALRKFISFISLIFFTATIILSCKKTTLITSQQALLAASADTLTFDTVFTSTGSVVKSFKIFNLNNQRIQLSRIKLMGGNASAFKLNIDGTASAEVDNIEIAANDSLYVFVQVNVNPASGTLPFIITDSILVSYNGNDKFVQLLAYGQNAVFLTNRTISGNVVFTNTLPYVILGGLLIDTAATLTLNKGCKIYLHADAPLIVDGTLLVNGTRDEQVVFNGDRLDPDYRDLPANWPGIYFRGSSQNNMLRHAVIKNAYQGLIAQDLSTTSNPKLTLSQCIIDNIYDAGILGINTTISVDNSLISNCGSNILLAYGGAYTFTQCTVASYPNIFLEHKDPVLQVYNFVKQGNQTLTADTRAEFTNCIFWSEGGSVDNEVVVNKQGSTVFEVTFDHVLYKAVNDPDASFTVPPIKNQDPLFDSINTSRNIFDFHITKNPSPATDQGSPATALTKDLDDKIRTGIPDLGCYEK